MPHFHQHNPAQMVLQGNSCTNTVHLSVTDWRIGQYCHRDSGSEKGIFDAQNHMGF